MSRKVVVVPLRKELCLSEMNRYVHKTQSKHDRQSSSSPSSSPVEDYNIISGLLGLGDDLLCHVVHGMSDGNDIIQLFLSSKTISNVRSHKTGGWAFSNAAAHCYSLRTVNTEAVDYV